MASAHDTIAAVATPFGRSGIGIVRLSGPAAPELARRVLGTLTPPRRAVLVTARDTHGEPLDRGLALYFPEPGSYTGEHMLEFHGHGGPAVLQAVLGAFLEAGARLAEPGEFTRRAFLNGKLDLAQAEAVADLIDAASREAARSALRSLEGAFSEQVRRIGSLLAELRVLVEAMLDFPEEEIEPLDRDTARERLERCAATTEELLREARRTVRLREGIHVVIVGRPNVGKSSLLNRLAGEERAIVTDVPGTTRDLVREDIAIEGVPLRIVDTAGLRETTDPVERIGVERAWAEVRRADVVLAVCEAPRGLAAEDAGLFAQLEKAVPAGAVRIRVYNKADLLVGPRPLEKGDVLVSAQTGEGIARLRRAILEAAGWTSAGEAPFLARERHLRALAEAGERLAQARQALPAWELFAEELRLAHRALGAITGEYTSEELLGEIFQRFCIGK